MEIDKEPRTKDIKKYSNLSLNKGINGIGTRIKNLIVSKRNEYESYKDFRSPTTNYVDEEDYALEKHREYVPESSFYSLNGGIEDSIKLSIDETLKVSGWDPEDFNQVFSGKHVSNRDSVFEILSFKTSGRSLKSVKLKEIAIDNEPVSTEPFDLSFSKSKYDVLRYDFKSSRKQKLKLFDGVFKNRDLDTAEFLHSLIEKIPDSFLTDGLKEIFILPRVNNTTGSVPEGGGTSGRMNLFLSREDKLEQIVETLFHEFGHLILKHLLNSTNPGFVWIKAMNDDNSFISEYSAVKKYSNRPFPDIGQVEDFAEAVRLYLTIDGKDSIIREKCKNRFELLDAIFLAPNKKIARKVLRR